MSAALRGMRLPRAARPARPDRPARALLAALGVLLALVVLAQPAVALAKGSASSGDSAGPAADAGGIGQLADRYESLDELANSLNPDDSVVVETRIGVLSSVNRALDGTTVRFSGEAVGDAVEADDGHTWVQLADQADSSIATYLSDDLAQEIGTYGGYNTTGATVEVTGEYHVACAEHQGELDVHVTRLSVSDAGGETVHAVRFERLAAGIALCAVGLGLVVLFVVLRRRRDKLDDGKDGVR